MGNQYREEREKRQEIVAVLRLSGMSANKIAHMLAVNPATIGKDLEYLQRKQTMPILPHGEKAIFRAMLEMYASCDFKHEHEPLEKIFKEFLGITEIEATFRGLDSVINNMRYPACQPKHIGYVRLLTALFGKKEVSVDTRYAWSQYLCDIAQGAALYVPANKEKLFDNFMEYCAVRYRTNIGPIWPTDAAEQIEAVLKTLIPRSALVLKMRFGIGYAVPQTFETIGAEINAGRERIRQLEAQALRKLRATAQYKLLHLWEHTTTDSENASEIRIERCEAYLSIRTRNSLRAGGIVLVSDLVNKSVSDLLRMQNFGRKSLREVKTLLASLGIVDWVVT